MNATGTGLELRGVVETADQRRFSAPAVNLTHASVFLETSEKLRVHDRVRLSLQELELEAEVGLVSSSPSGIVLSFRCTPDAAARLEGLIARVRVLPAGADEPWSEATVPGDDSDVALAMRAAASAHAGAGGSITDSIPPMNPAAATGEFHQLTPNPFASTTPTPFASQTPVPDDATAKAAEATLPDLSADGTLRFASADAFQTQFETNLVHGGIVARSTPLPIGSQKVLRLSVPGVSEELQLSARVGFVGQGTVGFMIDTFAVHRPRLESILERLS